jgi:LmbE family N-acetylglucosaminyl deacetylase
MKKVVLSIALIFIHSLVFSQPPQSWSSGQILQAIKKLNVLGTVIYIAAHPDDENTRLIGYLANEKLYRTGYLSLTRGDGGQNLIGDEQGIELGLIRTQELLSARRIDGGEQFFTSAYDFGYSKTPEETFDIWDKEKILSDVVWVIRYFRPDVIITRFPTTGEGGHGHHTASAILANEAFIAAADPNRFPQQLQYVQPWQAKRILWNTFNFGGNNTTSESQFKTDVGGFNPLLGKGYGEIAALSRSQHKSQGFGSAPVRGQAIEYFKPTGGTAPQTDLMDGVDLSWKRIGKEGAHIQELINNIEKDFDVAHPEKSVPVLVDLYKNISQLTEGNWKEKKLQEVQHLIAQCSGLFMDATTNRQFIAQGDSLKANITINNRLGIFAKLTNITINGQPFAHFPSPTELKKNTNYSFGKIFFIPYSKDISQPFWLKEKMDKGHFHIENQQLIGVADVQPAYLAEINLNIEGTNFTYSLPVKYRATDPVKGEEYQPLYIIPSTTVNIEPKLIIFKKGEKNTSSVNITTKGEKGHIGLQGKDFVSVTADDRMVNEKQFTLSAKDFKEPSETIYPTIKTANLNIDSANAYEIKTIQYAHIPTIAFFNIDHAKVLNIDLKTTEKRIGYIVGAGDKVPEALQQMGYNVTLLTQSNINSANLSGFDAIITGVRAYNTNEWLNGYYDKLMNYVKNGGNLIVQYNTSSNLGPVKAKIGPYDFTISRNRITNENAKVNIIDESHPVFNYPNKITQKDFEGWVQERSIYHAANWDKNFQPLISMADPGEAPNDGSLIVGKYGKGFFTYTGLVFFRELPAGVPGAYRLMANLIALNSKTATGKK